MRKLALLMASMAVLLAPAAVSADHLPESDAEALIILHDYYPGYW